MIPFSNLLNINFPIHAQELSYLKLKMIDTNTINLILKQKCIEGFSKSWEVVTYKDASEIWLLVAGVTGVVLPNW